MSLSMMFMGMDGAALALISTFLLPEAAGRDLRTVDAQLNS